LHSVRSVCPQALRAFAMGWNNSTNASDCVDSQRPMYVNPLDASGIREVFILLYTIVFVFAFFGELFGLISVDWVKAAFY
jgi:hypothetical protein